MRKTRYGARTSGAKQWLSLSVGFAASPSQILVLWGAECMGEKPGILFFDG